MVEPGQFVVVDTTEPYFFVLDGEWRMVSYRLPHAHLDARLGGRGLRTGVAIDGRGVGGVVPALMKALWEVGEDAGVSAARDLEDSFASAVAAATAALAGPGKPDRAAVRAAVLQHVRDSLTDRTLSVTTVCRRFAISPRILHNLFADAEVSFAATVRGLRLDRCAALLADPGVNATVTEIAAAHGFDDPTSFSRAFRRRFGVSPGRSAGAPCTNGTVFVRQGRDAEPGRREHRPHPTASSDEEPSMAVSFLLSPEQEQLKLAARQFAEEHLRGLAADVAAEPDPLTRALLARPVFEKAVGAGFLKGLIPCRSAVRRPAAWRRAILIEEWATRSPDFVISMAGPLIALSPVYEVGTPEQIERFVAPFLADDGAPVAAMAYSEPEGSANFAAPPPAEGTRTTAVPDGDTWVINGRKAWASHLPGWDGDGPDLMTIVCRTAGGISLIVAEREHLAATSRWRSTTTSPACAAA